VLTGVGTVFDSRAAMLNGLILAAQALGGIVLGLALVRRTAAVVAQKPLPA